jgi:hypothetical protein
MGLDHHNSLDQLTLWHTEPQRPCLRRGASILPPFAIVVDVNTLRPEKYKIDQLFDWSIALSR